MHTYAHQVQQQVQSQAQINLLQQQNALLSQQLAHNFSSSTLQPSFANSTYSFTIRRENLQCQEEEDPRLPLSSTMTDCQGPSLVPLE